MALKNELFTSIQKRASTRGNLSHDLKLTINRAVTKKVLKNIFTCQNRSETQQESDKKKTTELWPKMKPDLIEF